MPKFILLTFGFLGWAYFEMSGGTDFEPGWWLEAEAATTAPGDAVETEELVARAASGAAELTQVAAPADDTSTEGDNIELASLETSVTDAALTAVATRPEPRTLGLDIARRDPERAIAPETARTEEAAPAPDLREVSGSRVNLRQGPGTRHSVLTQLTGGTEVEVLRQEGGWVKLRVAETNRIGWMADYLVTAAAE